MTLQEYVDECIEKDLVHEIHTSERRSFRGCRRRWDWLYRQNYYPRVTAKPLEFGIAYHVGMETYYNPTTWGFDNEIKSARAIQAFIDECESQRSAALKGSDSFDLAPEIQKDYDERVKLGRGMMEFHFTRVAPKEDRHWKPVKVEVEFQVAIPHPDTGDFMFCKCTKCWYAYVVTTDDYKIHNDIAIGVSLPLPFPDWYWQQKRDHWVGLPVTYGGRLDMLAEDELGNYYIFDWKTTASIKDKAWLDLDDQIGSYVWALRKIGIPVMGFVYHEQLKNFPTEPEPLKRGSGGRMFSISKTQGTDYETFLRAVSRKDTEAWGAGYYDDYLKYLQSEGMKFYDRRRIDKTSAQCAEIERTIGEEALEMTNETLRTYPSPGRFTCDFCAFRQPCMEKNNRGDFQYALDTMYEKKQHYYLDKRANTDKEGN